MPEDFDNVGGMGGGILDLDFTGVSDAMEAVPVGLYRALVQKVESTKSKAGNAMLVLTFSITEPDEFAGSKLWDRLSLLPQSRWVVKRFLKATGVSEDDLEGPIQLDLDDLAGAEVVVEVEHRVWEGNTRSEIARYLPNNTPLSSESEDTAVDFAVEGDDDELF